MLLAVAAALALEQGTVSGAETSGLSKKSDLRAQPRAAERAVHTEAAGSSSTKLKWRPVRRASHHEDSAVQPAQAQQPRPLPFPSNGMRSVLAQRQGTSAPSTSTPNADPFNDRSLEPDAATPSPSTPATRAPGPFDPQPETTRGPFQTPATGTPAAPPTGAETRQPAHVNAGDPFDTPETEAAPQPREPAPLQPRAIDPSETPSNSDRTSDEQDREDCLNTLKVLKDSKLADIALDIRVTGQEGRDYPRECPLGVGEHLAPRMWESTIYTWKASALCHKPLYFEDVHLERYGHSRGPFIDPIVSAAHFFVAIPILPYKMGLEPPNECIYTLGYYRPGNCAPYLLDPIPFSPRGALFQAGAIAGAGPIFP